MDEIESDDVPDEGATAVGATTLQHDRGSSNLPALIANTEKMAEGATAVIKYATIRPMHTLCDTGGKV